jgi:type III secretory pathway component EscU
MITALIAYTVIVFWLIAGILSLYAMLFVLTFLFNYVSNLRELRR